MRRTAAAALLAAVAALGACSDDDDGDDAGTTTTASTAPVEETSTTSTTTAEATTTTTEAPEEVGDPAEAAEDFMAAVFPDSTATLSAFRQGDNRSGEIEVLRPREGGGTANVASTLLLRLDDADVWQVIGAVSPTVTIEAPENGAEVPPSPLTVSGIGRGFEGTLVVRAVEDDGAEVAQAIGAGGALADPIPYAVQLDLSGVGAGTPLVVVTSGGTGLEGDPGEFSAVRVVVG